MLFQFIPVLSNINIFLGIVSKCLYFVAYYIYFIIIMLILVVQNNHKQVC